jgi:hypothetical protein
MCIRVDNGKREGLMSDEQARRVGLNESIFRQVNEQIESLNRDQGTDGATMTVICECADGECAERFEISLSEYEKVRADPHRYVVVPGHQLPEFESVVERGDGYDVVEKREGTAAALAEETDPRS